MSSPSLTVNTKSLLETQERQLQQAVEDKKNHIAHLEQINSSLVYQAGKMSEATRAAQQIFQKPIFKDSLHHQLEHVNPSDPLQQMEQLIQLAEKVAQGQTSQTMDAQINQLNETVGKTRAQAILLEEEVQKLDQTIEKLQQLLNMRKKTINMMQSKTQELIDS